MSEKREIIKSYPLTVGTINLLSNGITEMRFNEKYTVDITALQEVQSKIVELAKERDIYLLVIPGPEGNMTEEASEAPMFDQSHTQGIAIITSLLHQRILGNLFFKFKKAKFKKYKLFSNESTAKEWLLLQLAKNQS